MYVVVNNYRNDDYRNFLYKSTDAGRSWSSIVADLPADRVLRTVREDPRNPDVLYVGAEIGLYVTIDGGGHWVELRNNLPTLAHNDLVVHPRDNDLVLGTHGRGIWILDNVNALQELNSDVLASEAHLFMIEPAEMIRYVRENAEAGDMVFKEENPPAGAIIDYYLARELPEDAISLGIIDAEGHEVRRLEAKTSAGINRVSGISATPSYPIRSARSPMSSARCRRGQTVPGLSRAITRYV